MCAINCLRSQYTTFTLCRTFLGGMVETYAIRERVHEARKKHSRGSRHMRGELQGLKSTPLCSATHKSESSSSSRRDSSPGGSMTHAPSTRGWHRQRNRGPHRHARTQTAGDSLLACKVNMTEERVSPLTMKELSSMHTPRAAEARTAQHVKYCKFV